MLITRVIAHEVIVHAKAGWVDSLEFGPSIFDKASKWIIELETDEGVTGVGETRRRVPESSVRELADDVLNRNPFDINLLGFHQQDFTDNDMFGHLKPPVPHRVCERDFGQGPAHLGYETALLDLWGKVTGVSACQFLGGRVRDAVPTDFWMGRQKPADAAKRIEEARELGFTSVKSKGALEDDIVGLVEAIKGAGGADFAVAIDPNQRFYRQAEAVPLARKLERFGDVVFEDPFPHRWEEWRLFRQKTSIPLACHGPASMILTALQHDAIDYANVSPGSHFEFVDTVRVVGSLGILTWHGSGLELGILDAAELCAAACCRTCVRPGDQIGWLIRENDLIEETLEVKDGEIAVPSGPGIGVTLDRDALEHYRLRTIHLPEE